MFAKSKTFAEGYEAFNQNLNSNDNPYEYDTENYKSWLEGFWKAFEDELYSEYLENRNNVIEMYNKKD